MAGLTHDVAPARPRLVPDLSTVPTVALGEVLIQLALTPVTAERPPRTEYHLTEKGHALEHAVSAITTWAHDWLTPSEAEAASHEAATDAAEPAVRAAGR